MDNTEILTQLAETARAASDSLTACQNRIRRALGDGRELTDRDITDLFLAEGVCHHYRALGYDGVVIIRYNDETDEDLVKCVRKERSKIARRLVEQPEGAAPPLAAARQQQSRNAARHVLTATAFLTADQ